MKDRGYTGWAGAGAPNGDDSAPVEEKPVEEVKEPKEVAEDKPDADDDE